MMKANTGLSDGFTLIELLIVIAIVGLLASIAIGNDKRPASGPRTGIERSQDFSGPDNRDNKSTNTVNTGF